MEKSKEKGESVTSSKEVLPILSSMAVEKGSRKVRRGRRDGIALQHESLTGKREEEKETTGNAHLVQSLESQRPLLVEDEEQGSLSTSSQQHNKYKQFSVKAGLANADSQGDLGKPEVTSAQLGITRLIVMDSGKRPLPAPSSTHQLSEKELESIFKEHDPILVKLTETGSRKRQLGYVDFASVGDAAAAKEALHMTKHGDFMLKLKWEKEKSPNHHSPPTTMQPTDVDAPMHNVR